MKPQIFLLAGAGTAVACALGAWWTLDEPDNSAAQLPRPTTSKVAPTRTAESRMLRESGEDGAEVGLGIEAPVPSAVPSQDYRSPAPVASVAELRPTEAMGGTEFGAKVVRQLQIEPRKLGQVGAQAFRALTLDLAPGVQQPIALLDATTDLPPPQAGALADIHNEFIEHIEAAAGVSSDQELNETWDRQQTEADSRYRIVFGEAAFMRMQMDAARNARGVPSGPDFP